MENAVKQKSSFFQVVLKTLKQLGKFIVDDCIKLPAYILAHPLKGFEEFNIDKDILDEELENANQVVYQKMLELQVKLEEEKAKRRRKKKC